MGGARGLTRIYEAVSVLSSGAQAGQTFAVGQGRREHGGIGRNRVLGRSMGWGEVDAPLLGWRSME